MTPTQTTALSVALDGLRESGFDEATLARMQRNTLFVACGNGEGTLGVFSGLDAAKAAVQLLYNDRVDNQPLKWVPEEWEPSGVETVVNCWRTDDEDRFGRVDEVVIDRPFAFSPAETPAAASVHRPEVCGDCLVHPCNCDTQHDRFPGAGAG